MQSLLTYSDKQTVETLHGNDISNKLTKIS